MSEAATRTFAEDGGPPRRRLARLTVRAPDGSTRSHAMNEDVVRVGKSKGTTITVDDPTVSRIHAEILQEPDLFRLRDLGSRNGTFVDGRRVWDVELRDGALVRLGRTEIELTVSDEQREVELSAHRSFGRLVGRSRAMRRLFHSLERVAPTDVRVLIEGETGTGKEVVARAIHERSARADGPFEVFDCGAIPRELAESHVFGHERGAFSGAAQPRAGIFEAADGGTLFLDELGELPLELQPKLLRALETGVVRRVGGVDEHHVSCRVLCATHRDLASQVNAGGFREDLYHRLAVLRVTVPPLRARLADLPDLVERFLEELVPDPERAAFLFARIDEKNWRRMRAHPWRGNARELRNVIERTIVLGEDAMSIRVDAGELDGHAGGLGAVDLSRPFMDQKASVIRSFERAYLLGILEHAGGNVSQAARAAGLERTQFRRLLRKYTS